MCVPCLLAQASQDDWTSMQSSLKLLQADFEEELEEHKAELKKKTRLKWVHQLVLLSLMTGSKCMCLARVQGCCSRNADGSCRQSHLPLVLTHCQAGPKCNCCLTAAQRLLAVLQRKSG